ncbi:uncharacterized protein VP01_3211g1, partial [Puccinia sorghi]
MLMILQGIYPNNGTSTFPTSSPSLAWTQSAGSSYDCCTLLSWGLSHACRNKKNTPNPGVSLNPCRICSLNVSTLANKPSETYVMQCVGLNSLGERVGSNLRKLSEKISQTHELWEIATNQSKNAYTSASKKYGIQDNINDVFINQWKTRNNEKINKINILIENGKVNKIFNPFLRLKGAVSYLISILGFFINVKTDMVLNFILGFDGCNDTPVELIASWEIFNKESLDLAELNVIYF